MRTLIRIIGIVLCAVAPATAGVLTPPEEVKDCFVGRIDRQIENDTLYLTWYLTTP